ncbi:hypothetical protein V6N13_062644 [Hibiscus sabdariffa]
MDCKKFASVLVPMAICLLLATMSPTVTAARNGVMPFSIIGDANIRNPFAGVFYVDKPAENCYASGIVCVSNSDCCSRRCSPFVLAPLMLACE